MELNPMAVALVSIIGTIIVLLISLLLAMVKGLKDDVVSRDKAMTDKIEAIALRLTHMVLAEDYKEDKKEVTLKLDDHGDRILTLEIRVKEQSKDEKH
jgi:hypothetical protein